MIMTNFEGIKFTHQDPNEYGEGRKVTTKILTNDAENTENLNKRLTKIETQTSQPLLQTITPITPTSSNNTTAETISTAKQVQTSTGEIIRIPPQTVHELSSSNTEGYLYSNQLTAVNAKWQKLHTPTICEVNTNITKHLIGGSNITTTINVIPTTLNSLTGNNNGTIATNSYIYKYLQWNTSEETPTLTSLEDLEEWLLLNYQAFYDVHKDFTTYMTKYQKKTIDATFTDDDEETQAYMTDIAFKDMPSPYFYDLTNCGVYITEDGTTTTLSSIDYTVDYSMGFIQLDLSNYIISDISKIEVKAPSVLLYNYSEDVITLGSQTEEYTVTDITSENLYTLRFPPVIDDYYYEQPSLQVYKNGIEQILGIDYTYNSNDNTFSLESRNKGDIIQAVYTPDIPSTLKVVYELERSSTENNCYMTYIQAELVGE